MREGRGEEALAVAEGRSDLQPQLPLPLHCNRATELLTALVLAYTSRFTVRYDGLQQYLRKLSTKNSQYFLLIISAFYILFF